MSWVKTDDSLHDSAKVAVLSDAAFRLWSMALCWSNRTENETTGGFIPEALLAAKISEGRWPGAKLKKLVTELVNCGKVVGKSGLWEAADGGWIIHDWHDYRPQQAKLSRQEAARVAGQRSAVARRERTGTAQPNVPERKSNVRETFDEQRSGDVRSNETRTSRTPVPVPVPVPVPAADPRPPGPERVTVTPTQQQRQFAEHSRNLEEALRISIQDRALMLIESPHLADWTEPHKWPEVQRLAERFSKALGWHEPRFLRPDAPVLRLVELLATFAPEDLSKAVSQAPKDPWLTSGSKGLGSLSPEVVRRLLNGSESKPRVDENEVRERQEATKREVRANLAAQHAKLQAKAAG